MMIFVQGGLRFGSGSPTLHASSLGFSESIVGGGGGYSECKFMHIPLNYFISTR